MFRWIALILVCFGAVCAEAEPLSEIARRIAEHYRDNPVEAILTPAVQADVAAIHASADPPNRVANLVAQKLLNARLKQLAALKNAEGGPLFTAEEIGNLRSSYFRVRSQIDPTRINGKYSPVSPQFGNQTSVVEIPKELDGTSIFHALKLHETEHLIQHELAKKWGLGDAYGSAMDRLTKSDPAAVFVAEYGAMGMEAAFVRLIPPKDRQTLSGIIDSLPDLAANSRSFAERLLSFRRGTADHYRLLNWHRGRYGWDQFASRSFELPPDLVKILPIARSAFSYGAVTLACANMYRSILSLLGR